MLKYQNIGAHWVHNSNPPTYYLPRDNIYKSEMEWKLNEIHKYEEQHKGAFIRIFPDPEDNPKEYLKYFEVAKKESKDFTNKYHKK